MPFWKQSEDPWDRKPDKPRREPREPQVNPLDSLKTWNQERKAKAREKEEARRLPPEPCPWCGKSMEQGFLEGGRDSVHWYAGIRRFDPFRGFDGGSINVLNECNAFFSNHFKVAWLCRECGKIVFDIPESDRIYDFPDLQEDGIYKTTQEEEMSEE